MKFHHNISVIRGYPEISARVGWFFAEFAAFEWELREILPEILDGGRHLAEFIFSDRVPVSERFLRTELIARSGDSDSPAAQFFHKRKNEFQEIISFRNALAHGVYGSFSRLEIRVTTFDLKKKYVLDIVKFDMWLERLANISDECNAVRREMIERAKVSK